MEKNSPHCKLAVVQALVSCGKVRFTGSALRDAALIGFDTVAIIDVVQALTKNDFYKSMTTYADHRIWQDVYHPRVADVVLYLKLTVIEDVLVVSFKEQGS